MHRSIRSFKSVRRLCVLLVAMLSLAVVLPAGALAQNVSPTDEEYGNGVLGVAAGGDPADPADPAATSGSGSEISSLPFTGLDVAAIAAIGVGLVAAGFVVRRASRTTEEPV